MKMLIAGNWQPGYFGQVRESFPDVHFVHVPDPADALREVVDADAIFGQPGPELIRAAKQLRWVQSPSAGCEWMWNTPELPSLDITVTNMRGAHAATIAEHFFAMTLYLTRQFPALVEAQRARKWLRPVVPAPVGLSGKTLGVLGLGNIGRAIAQRGKGFDMRVIAVDINEVEQPPYVDELHRLDGLHHMLEQADFQAIAIPITPESRGMIGAAQLEVMKPTAYLGIMSRGKIVDEQALVGALKENMLAGVGADVMAIEPMGDDNPLWDAPRTILSPHMSGQSEQTSAGVAAILEENIRRFLAGEELYNVVIKERGY
jgi:phosphoglycerate dehydrogenase-like enzyme